MSRKVSISYSKAGVSYEALDPVKKNAQKLAKTTAKHLRNHGAIEVTESRGESAYVWDCGSHFRALVIEGLGTKNLVADEVEKITGRNYYRHIAQDTVATIINDLVTVGAKPEVLNAYFAIGDSSWFRDKRRIENLLTGFKKACDLVPVTWGGGETPALGGIVDAIAIELGGAATGVIKPKSRLTLGDKLQVGDRIILIASSGIHANGLTLARQIAQKLEKRFATKMKNGKMFGEALLEPTIIYSNLIQELFKAKVDIHYMVNVTGHGWRKLMRHPKNLTYVIENIPKPQEEFLFMQKHGPIADKEAYATFNMGAGFAIFINKKDVAKVEKVARRQKIKVLDAGFIKKGPRQVIIKPKNITYKSETLDLR